MQRIAVWKHSSPMRQRNTRSRTAKKVGPSLRKKTCCHRGLSSTSLLPYTAGMSAPLLETGTGQPEYGGTGFIADLVSDSVGCYLLPCFINQHMAIHWNAASHATINAVST